MVEVKGFSKEEAKRLVGSPVMKRVLQEENPALSRGKSARSWGRRRKGKEKRNGSKHLAA
ncbi:MAG: hypothetical protein Q8P46_03135 [Hyphomicrobiales bacterium]|nr:hypothetical protein [Hyphomicrobiales bacterium]